MKKIELEYYNRKELWTQAACNSFFIKRAAEETVRLIPSDVKSVIDIGCGNGTITNLIDRSFVVGIDFAKAPLLMMNKEPIIGSADALPIKEGEFDIILLTEVLEHLDDDTYFNAINEIKRLNAKYILISVPHMEDLSITLSKCNKCGNIFNASHHYRSFSNGWHKQVFEEYIPLKIVKFGKCVAPSKNLARIKRKFNLYFFTENAVCNRCGGRAMKSPFLLRYPFIILDYIEFALKKIIGKVRPCRQIILLERKNFK